MRRSLHAQWSSRVYNLLYRTLWGYHEVYIMKCTPGWTDELRQKIYRIDQGKYKIKSLVSTQLIYIIGALFKHNRFIPITIGSVFWYSSTLYKEKHDKLKTLEYDESRCCQLKQKFVNKPKNPKKDYQYGESIVQLNFLKD